MKNNGFSSIEFFFIMVILFIFGATIAPQFINIKEETKITVAKSIKNAIKNSLNFIKSQAILNAAEKEPDFIIDGVRISYGYPAATLDGIGEVISFSDSIHLNEVFIDTKNNKPPINSERFKKIVVFVIGQDKTYSITEENACQIPSYKVNENRKQPTQL